MIGDRNALVADLRALVTRLEDDIRDRISEVSELRAHLRHEHAKAADAQRTAMSVEEWSEGEITQAAVAWVLGCVFVRFIEDNGLIDSPLISGSGDRRTAALGQRDEHFRQHPEHSDREYLETVFAQVASHPPVAPLYDRRLNPIWQLGPTADGARELRDFWTQIDPDTGALVHDFTEPALGTRFLGDLYQNLSETAKKRYALLQTPEFVEEFILDRTLDPAIEEFGLDQVRMIDPTCGSGHFLIGSFERLFARWRDREPGTGAEVLAQRALDAVHGVDLNPFATAIARFRLLVAALRACGIGRLAEAPAFHLNLATGDSLLHGAELGQFDGFGRYREGIRHVFETEDAADLQHILGKGYHAVVGNPPYITGSDEDVRAAYRKRYKSCHREFALTVPFMERFFDLARPEAPSGAGILPGFVGKITGNSFMQREFGLKLVRDYLPSVDVSTVVDTSTAYIPGHGTPTVLLFGRSRLPLSNVLRVVDSIRTEATQPKDPARGLVWRAIEAFVDRAGEGDQFVRTSDMDRRELLTHPMMLGPGRAVVKRLKSESIVTLGSLAVDVGYTGQTNIDDAMLRPPAVWKRTSVDPSYVMQLVVGDEVRDWRVSSEVSSWYPYSDERLQSPSELGPALKALWPWRTSAWARRTFSKQSYRAEGRTWYEWHQIALRRHRTLLSICWAFVATHNHFVLDRGGKVFNRTAPIIKLPAAATEEDHLALLGVLNSSAACCWLKQVTYDRGGGGIGGGIAEEAWERFYELSAGRVRDFPLPQRRPVELAEELDRLSTERARLFESVPSVVQDVRLAEHFADLRGKDAELSAKLVSLQEELDWQALRDFGLAPDDLPVLGLDAPPIVPGQRAFEVSLARELATGTTSTTWFERHGSAPVTDLPADWPAEYRSVVRRRIEHIENDPEIGFIERPEHKRRWAGEPWQDRERRALTAVALDSLEAVELWSAVTLRSTAQLADVVPTRPLADRGGRAARRDARCRHRRHRRAAPPRCRGAASRRSAPDRERSPETSSLGARVGPPAPRGQHRRPSRPA